MCCRPWGWNPRFGKVLSVSAISVPHSHTHTHVCSLASELLQRAKPISPITANQASSRLSVFENVQNISLLLIYPSLYLWKTVSFFSFLPITNQEHHHLSFSRSLSDRHGDQRDFSALTALVYSWLTSSKKKLGLGSRRFHLDAKDHSSSHQDWRDNIRQSQSQIWIRPTWLKIENKAKLNIAVRVIWLWMFEDSIRKL